MSVDTPLARAIDARPAGRRSTGVLAIAFVRQFLYEHLLLSRRGIRFRTRDTAAVRAAYSAMSPAEFDGINARQRWANWRTIPRNLDAHMTARPVCAIDLCCGAGHSTEVLAHVLPIGSRILGLDVSASLVRAARTRPYPDAEGRPCLVRFRVQSVLEPFREPDGALVGDGSVDLVHSSGAVGSHFAPDDTRLLLAETFRVVRPNGLALVDAGPGGTRPGRLEDLLREVGFEVCQRARSCFLDRYWQYCCRRRSGEGPAPLGR